MPARRLPLLLTLLVSLACAHQQPPQTFRETDAAIEKELAGGIPSVAFAIAQNGRIVHEGAFGFADASRRATVDTPYPLASVTKPLVATAVMALAERKKLDLDQPASVYAGGWVAAGDRYTVRQLLNHTSGLPTYATIRWQGEPSPQSDLRGMFRRYGFGAHPPGTVSEYSNIGYGLLGHILATQAGQPLAKVLDREVFQPLGMNHTVMIESGAAPPDGARKYDMEGKALPDTFNDTPGAGNVYASVHDLARFGVFHLDNSSRVISPATKELMHSYADPNALYPYYDSSRYGLGWYFRTTADGTRVVWHEGGMPGASSILVLLPQQGIVAAVVINANDRNDVAQAVANRLIAAVAPSIKPLTFVPTDGFSPYEAQPAYLGKWEGALTIDGRPLACSMTFTPGKITVTFPQQKPDDLLPRESTFQALVNGDLLLGTIAATLPAEDVMQKKGGYVLLRLVRRGDQLNGTMIAYAAPDGLRHLYPFEVSLKRAR